MLIDKECPERWPSTMIWNDKEALIPLIGHRLCDGYWHYGIQADYDSGKPQIVVQYMCPKSEYAAGVTDQLTDAQTFDSFDPKYQEQAFGRVSKWAESFHPKRTKNLILIGPWGTGKTHLAMACYHALRQRGYAVQKISAEKLMSLFLAAEPTVDYREEHESARQILKRLRDADMVILDDLGGQSVKAEGDWFVSKFKVLIDELSGPFILTSNSTQQQLEERYGSAVISRLLHDTIVIAMPGEDYRRRKVKK